MQQRFADRTVRLTQNFRSLRPVIDWVNAVFAPLMGEGAAEGQVPYVELDCPLGAAGGRGRHRPHPGGTRRREHRADTGAREAAELAQLIQTAKAEGWPVAENDPDGRRVFRPPATPTSPY